MAPGPGPGPGPAADSLALVSTPSVVPSFTSLAVTHRGSALEPWNTQAENFGDTTEKIKTFLEETDGSSLRAWLKYFDRDCDIAIPIDQLARGLQDLGYPGTIDQICASLDTNRSGEIALEDIDKSQSILWQRFVTWCSSRFETAESMIREIAEQTVQEPSQHRTTQPSEAQLTCDHFTTGVHALQWGWGYEGLLYDAIDKDDGGTIGVDDLWWMVPERMRYRNKKFARMKSLACVPKKISDKLVAASVLDSFRRFLRQKFGYYLKAWRNLSPNGNLVLQKSDLFKACAKLSWQGDVRLLYKAFDKDGSGYISLEELDVISAEILAKFHLLIRTRFGTVADTFQAFDKHKLRRIRFVDFDEVLQENGFDRASAKLLFHGLDRHDNKFLSQEDLVFLEEHKPTAIVLANPNPQAAEEVKSCLQKCYQNYLKAWRRGLDLDNDSRLNYDEFLSCCSSKLGFHGDVAGAWRALDSNRTGYITFSSFDPDAANDLQVFKAWCDEEFGGVRSATEFLLSAQNRGISYTEFRKACRQYGFEGQVRSLFVTLDVDENKELYLNDVAFLEAWDFPESHPSPGENWAPRGSRMDKAGTYHQPEPGFRSSHLPEYDTSGPGPAAYEVPTTVGVGPASQVVHFNGSYTIQRRRTFQLPGLGESGKIPAPFSYSTAFVSLNKPSWVFGSARREANEVPVQDGSPGPGTYTLHQREGPSAFCTPRRKLKVHPLLACPPGSAPLGKWNVPPNGVHVNRFVCLPSLA